MKWKKIDRVGGKKRKKILDNSIHYYAFP